jgi:hypothetical protein
MNRSGAFGVLLGLMLAALVIAAYAPGLSGDFIFDDQTNILDRPAAQIESLDTESLAAAAGAYGGLWGRPLSTLSLGLDWYFWGDDATGFKLTNLILHLINTVLMILLAQRLLTLSDSRSRLPPWPAWAAIALAGIWAVHPLQVSTVLYAVQRMEILALTFTLLALLAYLRGRMLQTNGRPRGWLWLLGSGLLGFLALLAKETGLLVPVFALGLEVVLLGFRARQGRDTALLKWLYGIGVSIALAMFVLIFVPQYTDPEAYLRRDFTWIERILTQLRVLPMYLSWIVAPIPDRMMFYYDGLVPSSGWLTPITTLLGGLLLAALAAGAWLLSRVAPLATLGILWFFSAHLLTSNIVPLELAFEHRNYFAVFPVILAIAALTRLLPAERLRLPLPALSIALIVGLALLTAIRAATWGEPLNLAMYHRGLNPASERAGLDLGEIYLDMSGGSPNLPFFGFALNEFQRVARMERSSPIAAQALIVSAVQLGEDPDPEWQSIFLEKLATRPVNDPFLASIDSLIRRRFAGDPVPRELLIEAHGILLERRGVSPLIHTRFGYLGLETFKDDDFAFEAFRHAIRLMGDDRIEVDRFLASLREDGHGAMAARLEALPRATRLEPQ